MLMIITLSTNDRIRYLQLIETHNGYNQVKHALTPDGIGSAEEDKRMIMSDMDIFIGQKYKYAVVLISIKKDRLKTFPL